MLKFSTLCFLISFNLFPQGKFAYQISAIFPQAHYIGKSYTNATSYSRTAIFEYAFEIKFSLKLNGKDFIWDKPIALTIQGSQNAYAVLNPECMVLDSKQLYEYTFIFKTKNNTVLDFEIGELDVENRSIETYSNVRFSGNSIYINVDNLK